MDTTYERYLCPVSGFFNAIKDGRKEVKHDAKKQLITFKCESFEASSYYYFLNDEIILSYAHILPLENIATKLQPHNGRRFYIFNMHHNYPNSVALQVNDRKFSISGDTLIFTNSDCHFQIFEKARVERSYFQIVITEYFLHEFIEPGILSQSKISNILDFAENKVLLMNNYPEILQNEFKELIYLFSVGQANEFSKLKIFKIISNFIGSFLKNYRPDETGAEELAPHSERGELVLKKYLDDHVEGSFIGIDKMAKMFHMSNSTLNRNFIKAFNITPFEYFKKAQIEHAKKLLIETELSVSEIAYRLGFESPANFIRSFKKIAQITPGAFKSQFSNM